MKDLKDTEQESGKSKDLPRPLTLKGPARSTGSVRQSLSHGKSRSVVVERKKKRLVGGPGAQNRKKEETSSSVNMARKLGLSQQEYERRQKALVVAKTEEGQRKAAALHEEEARHRRLEEEKSLLEEKRQAEQRREEERLEEEARLKEEKASEQKKSQHASPPQKAGQDQQTILSEAPLPDHKVQDKGRLKHRYERTGGDEASDDFRGRSKKKLSPPRHASGGRHETRRRQGKLTITSALQGDEERERSLSSVRRARLRERERRQKMQDNQEQEKIKREVIIPEVILLQDLAARMAERSTDVIKYLMKQGVMIKLGDSIDADMAQLIVEDFGHTAKRVAEADVEEGLVGSEDNPEDMQIRPPVVTVMGHVDHGKTSVLDALRDTNIASGEKGGITQHIGAYQVHLPSGQRISFIDTPGHAAFSAMRARGASLTDIVVLVVAADDGVMPQTIEAIHHTKEAKTPVIIAVNKMDKTGADPQKVLQGLLQHGIIAESMGGDVQVVEISALKRQGLDSLLEAITLQAELMELKANPARSAEGVVLESLVNKGQGPVASVIVQRGTLRQGDIVVAGAQWGKVRALIDERDQRREFASPADPVVLLGLDGAADPGDIFAVVDSEARAREITDYRRRKKQERGQIQPVASFDELMSQLKEKKVEELPVLIKADTQGSAEAIQVALEKLGNDEVRSRIVLASAGAIAESDILLARAAGAPVVGFNVRASRQARDLAEHEGVEIRYYAIIYDLIDDIKAALSGLLSPELREDFLGNAEVLEVFSLSKKGKIAGCRVTEGLVRRGSKVRIVRDDIVIYEGELSTLRRFKDDVEEVKAPQECGMGFAQHQDISQGDMLECFDVKEIQRSL